MVVLSQPLHKTRIIAGALPYGNAAIPALRFCLCLFIDRNDFVIRIGLAETLHSESTSLPNSPSIECQNGIVVTANARPVNARLSASPKAVCCRNNDIIRVISFVPGC